ncbi:uncharacterized protein LOC121890458 isoform X1 [Thunnus maccoyii]|uniref:uncharacterized protein LOC121890458 isoform X1 n=2 Tax=Thunnus maccoyii TaxID=8240 RepID=UPI001C4AF942|nr:uncharacterized protein LOC121890458 isoform X1 [Thunnus maccoyii]XP_042258662.1 uncharacterized protein LOC121890458 isoform X1 [Thunnus maccoyii]
MRSGCPHRQGGAYPAFQHLSNIGALTSPQDNNVRPEPVAHPENEKQNIMVAISYSTELRNVNDSHSSAQHSSYFGTSANENFDRQSIYNSGQQKECSKSNFSRNSLEGSNLNKNNGLQLRNGAFLASTNAAVLQEDSLGVLTKTFSSRQRSSVLESKWQSSCPLLQSLLTGNPPDFKSFFTTSHSSSEKTNSNMELIASDHLSDERHCKSRHMRRSLPTPNCGQTRTQNPDQSGGTYPTLHQQQVCSPSLSGAPSTGKDLPVGLTKPPTDEEIQNHISKRLKEFRKIIMDRQGLKLSNKGGNFSTNDLDSTLQSGCTMSKSNSVTLISTVSESDKDVEKQSPNFVVEEQCTAAVGQELEEDSSKDSKAKQAEFTPKSKEMGDCTTSASGNHSTGTLLSAIKSSKHAPESESVEKSASVASDLPIKKHLDVTMTAFGDGNFVSSNDESFHSKWWCDKPLQKVTTLHYTLTALRELITSLEKVETIAEMDNFSEVILQQYWNGDIDNIHLFTSTEYPQIMVNVAATCTKNEDECPVVLTAVSGITLDELTERHSILTQLMFNCSSSQKEWRSVWLNTSKKLDDIDQEPSVSGPLKHMTVKERGFTGLKPAETAGLDSVQVVTDVSKDLPPESDSVVSENKTFELMSPTDKHNANTNKQKNTEDQQHCCVTCDEVIALSKPNSLIDQIQNVVSIPTYQSEQSFAGAREEAGSVYSPMDLSVALSENEVKEQGPLSESEDEEVLSPKFLKDPQYDDISDDDVPPLSTELPKTEHEELSFPTRFGDPQYEEISEDENSQIENPSFSQLPEPNNKRSLFENEGYRQSQAQMKTEKISAETLIPKKQVSPKTLVLAAQYHCCPHLVLSGDGFEGLSCPKCDREGYMARRTNHSVSYSPSNVLKYDDQTEEDTDDDCLVIPITMSDLKSGLEDEDQDGPEEVVRDDGENGDNERQGGTSPTHDALHVPAPKPVPASDSTLLEIYDTMEIFLQVKSARGGNCFEVAPGRSTPEHGMNSEGEPHTPQERRESYSEPEDSCETEDSCDYSSASEHNYLTVPRQLLKRSAPPPPERDHSVSEKESDSDEASNSNPSKHVQPKTNKQRISKKEEIIIINTDTEDEGDHNCNKKVKRKRLFSRLVNIGDTLCSQQKRHSPETEDSPCGTVKERFEKNRQQSADLPAPHRQSKAKESQLKGLMEDACPGQSHSTEKSGQLTEASAGFEQHKINREMISKKQSVIILNSDTEDESGYNYKEAKRNRLYLPGSADSGDAPHVQRKRRSDEIVDTQYGTANEKLKKPRLSPADFSMPQHQTKVHETMRKSGQLIEPKPRFEHIQHKTTRQTTSKEERTVFHGSEKVVKSGHFCKKKEKDSGNDSFATQNGPSTETVDRLSCEDSPEKQPLSVDKVVGSSLVTNPVIHRLVVEESFQPNNYLKLYKDSRVHNKDKDETWVPQTPTATSEKSDSCYRNKPYLYRNKKGQFVSKPKPAKERHSHETKNERQANITKPKLVSRQPSLPSQEGQFTSTSSLSSTRGQLSEARGSSTSSRHWSQSEAVSASSAPPKSKQSPPISRHLSSSKLQRSYSYSSHSTSDHHHTTKGPSSSVNTQSSARKQVIQDWHNSYFPTRRDRKTSLGMEEDLRTTNNDSQREARPGPSHYERAPRQRHRSYDPPTALMKKSIHEAKQWTNHIHREAPREPRSVGRGYKWSENSLATPTKGSGRKRKKCRFSPRPHQ